jgi:hypothetical protein
MNGADEVSPVEPDLSDPDDGDVRRAYDVIDPSEIL